MLDYQIGDRGIKTFEKLYFRLHRKYKIKAFATDNYSVYREVIFDEEHYIGKQYTQGIESFNSIIRNSLGCLVRRTKCYSKSAETMKCLLNILFYWKGV